MTDPGVAGDGFVPRLQPTIGAPTSVAAIATAATSVGEIRADTPTTLGPVSHCG